MKVCVIGAGTMGNGIAHVFAQHDYSVNLCDINQDQLEKAIQMIDKNLSRQAAKEKISEAQKIKALGNITTFTDLNAAASDRDIIIEAASELEHIKISIFSELDKIAPRHAILATNTSSISITKIASATTRPDKVIGMHFMNPVPIMKLVEVIKGYNTSKEVTAQVIKLSKAISKIPVEVNDFPGFIANRILMPMINEAIYALYEGVSGVQEIDQIMKLGMAHPMGPLELADFIGLDVCKAILDVLYDGLGQDKYFPCPLLNNMVLAGNLGRKTGEGFYVYNKDSKEYQVSEYFK